MTIMIGFPAGPFHCGDAMAAAIIQQALGGHGKSCIKRTSCDKQLNGCYIQVTDKKVQAGCTHVQWRQKKAMLEKARDFDAPFATAGEAWKDWGSRVVSWDAWLYVDAVLIAGIDRHELSYGRQELPVSSNLTLVEIVNQLNPTGRTLSGYSTTADKDNGETEWFLKAVAICSTVLCSAERKFHDIWDDDLTRGDSGGRFKNRVYLGDKERARPCAGADRVDTDI